MGCFLACFGSEKGRRRRKSRPEKKIIPRDRSHKSYTSLQANSPPNQTTPEIASPKTTSPSKQTAPETASLQPIFPLKQIDSEAVPSNNIQESRSFIRHKSEDLSFNGRKKVTFDPNVKAYDAEIVSQEAPNSSSKSDVDKERQEIENIKVGKVNQSSAVSDDNSTTSSTSSYPSNHRYENCASSDDEAEYEDSDNEDGDDNDNVDDLVEEGEGESFDSYFSLPMDKEREISSPHKSEKKEVNTKPICVSSPDRKTTLLGNGSARDRSQYVHSVLNPVENLSQWKAVKAGSAPLKPQRKENFNLGQEVQIPFCAEPTFKAPKPEISVNSSPSFKVTKSHPKQEISVDASLSNWLGSSETTPSVKNSIAGSELSENSVSQRSYTSTNREDRPILGSLTIEEIRQSSASSSPRRSPTRSPDEIPIVGTVGGYWNHVDVATNSSSSQKSGSDSKGIPNTTSKYREDKRVNWHNTPFEVRLERALTVGDPEAYSSYSTKVSVK